MLEFIDWLEETGVEVVDVDYDWDTSGVEVGGTPVVIFTTGGHAVLADNQYAKQMWELYNV